MEQPRYANLLDSTGNAITICVCTLWLFEHRLLINRGFILRSRSRSDDTVAAVFTGLTATVWSITVGLSAVTSFTNHSGPESSLGRRLLVLTARLADVPVLPLAIFVLWATVLGVWQGSEQVPPSRFWSQQLVRGPYDWIGGLRDGMRRRLLIGSGLAIIIPSVASAAIGDYTTSILNVVAFLLFSLDGIQAHPYNEASHRYSGDYLRIALATDHHEGTVYVLPSSLGGMDAVWSPKIDDEHTAANGEIMTLLRHMRSDRWHIGEPLERLRKTMAVYRQRALPTVEDVERLACWIYVDKNDPRAAEMAALRCKRAAGVHLIGRDLMFALCHAEYLVFVSQGGLANKYQQRLFSLRFMRRSGAGQLVEDPDRHTIGFRPGYQGYKEAVEHVYAIFGYASPDDQALNFSGTAPPGYSFALKKAPETIDQYVSDLWDVSIQNTESTFSALYFFTTVWFMELGNVNGFHIFPLRCRSREGDATTQQLLWRQAWYTACVAQLVSVSPAVLAWFTLGI